MPNTTGSLDGKVAYVTGQWHRLRHRTGVRPPRRQRRGRRHRPPRQPGHRPHDREPRRPGPRRQRRRDPQRGRTSRPHQDSGEVRAHGLRLHNAGAEQQPKASSVSRLDPSGAVQVDAEHPSRNRKVAGLNSTLRSKQQKARPPGARWALRARWCVHASGDRITRSRWTQPVTPGWAA